MHCSESIRLPPETAYAAYDRGAERLNETINHLLGYLGAELLLIARRRIEVPHSRIALVYRPTNKAAFYEPI